MAQQPTSPRDSANADDGDRDVPATPDGDSPHDVPDNEVIEHTLPSGSKKRDTSWPGDTHLPR
jgi:hypothetical protein